MSILDLTAGTIMNSAAALLNDTARQKYTYAVQIPFLKMALKELREIFELSGLPVTNKSSPAVLTIPAGTTVISYTSTPALPVDLVEIIDVWERATGVDPYLPMNRVDFIPSYDSTQVSYFGIYSLNGNALQVKAANRINDLKIDYIAELFTAVVDENSPIAVINGELFLNFRTAGLVAENIEENLEKGTSLSGQAYTALERATGIVIKAEQGMGVRRRPFRLSHKLRGFGR